MPAHRLKTSSPSGADAVGRITTLPSPNSARDSENRSTSSDQGSNSPDPISSRVLWPVTEGSSSHGHRAHLAVEAAAELGGHVQGGVEVLGFRPVVHDGHTEHEPIVQHGVRTVHAAVQLQLDQDPLVQHG